AFEEAVLQLLLNILSQCGVAFPTSCPASSEEASSTPNLSMPRDDLALEVQEAWDDVRFSLRSHLLGKLQMMTEPSQTEGELSKIFYLQQLLFLYPETKVFSWYQHLQIKAVLSVLRNCQSCIPGGEKGFDRLSLGFQRASPALCSMLREEIHVLNGVAEPYNILAFLNHVYLNTVAQELGVLMDKEIETALKDNTTHSMKGGKLSSK
ncbi:hypothetical protein M9458_011165, partial [Cirrhinus mrigala]